MFSLSGRAGARLFSENYYAEPEATLKHLTSFLEMPPFDAPPIGVRNAAPTTLLSASQRGRLEERFSADATALAELLGEAPPWPWLTAA